MQQAGCDVIIYQLRGHMLARSKRFIFADWAGLIDLEPSGDTSCVVVMLARQCYHTFSVSESRQADRTVFMVCLPGEKP